MPDTIRVKIIVSVSRRLPWLNRRMLAWASYDIANSAYFGIAPSLLFPLYFTDRLQHVSNPTAAWGALAAVAVLLSSLAALGAATLSRHVPRYRLLCLFSSGLVLALVPLAVSPPPALLLAVLGFMAAQIFYFAASTVYESFLPDLLPPGRVQMLSGFGWGLGYLGGLLVIGLLLLLVAGHAESPGLLASCFAVLVVASAVLFLIVLAIMRRAGFAALGSSSNFMPDDFLRPREILFDWRPHRRLLALLTGTFLASTGLSVIVTFTAPILATRFGQGLGDLLWLLLVVHLLAVPSTLIWNHLLTGWSRVATLALLLGSWCAVLPLLALGAGSWVPVVTVIMIGCCLGATSSALRGFVAEIVPDGGGPAYFALATVCTRAAAALGPALFAIITALVNERAALLAVCVVMMLGMGLLVRHVRQPLPGPSRQ